MRPVKDLTGRRFGRLIVISESNRSSKGKVMWNCICECGNEVSILSSSLLNNNTNSCGCLHKEVNITHGLSNTPEYASWNMMRQRCLNSKCEAYSYYGGRGITICDRWLNSFENFLMDMGYRPSDIHTIDRRENDGNYEPSNCYWATKEEQNNNVRSNVVVSYADKDYTLAQLSREFNINQKVLRDRINRGWSVKDTVETPIRNYNTDQ